LSYSGRRSRLAVAGRNDFYPSASDGTYRVTGSPRRGITWRLSWRRPRAPARRGGT